MKALHDLQQAFAADLWGDDLHHAQDLIIEDELPAARRFNVYRNNFQTSLSNALAAIYPVVEKLVGLEFFGLISEQYIRMHPSGSGNLHNLGHALADFLSNFQAASHLPYLPDVARLEWAYHEVFHASAPPSFEPNALEQVAAGSYPRLRFVLGPACRMLRSTYPIFRIWQTNQDDYGGDDKVSLDMGPETVLVVRPKLEVELWRLDPGESEFLKALESGNDLGEAVETSVMHSPEFDLQLVLGKFLLSGGLVVAEL